MSGAMGRNSAFRLEKLSPGSTFWTEEQSRVNFDVVSRLTTPGDPLLSRLLMHPLDPKAGGDEYHYGGRQFASQDDPDWQTLLDWVRGIALPLSARTVLIYVTNHAGDNVDVIDPETNKVVQTIEDVELSHGIDFSPDGRLAYLSLESENVLDVVDRKTGQSIKKVPLSGRPNNIAITKDGGRVFVAIREAPGALDIVNTTSFAVKTIPMKGPLHNVHVTPDGKFAVMGSPEGKFLTVMDVQTEQTAWEIPFDNSVRTMAFERGPDGSTRRIFVSVGFFHGFEVVDFAERKVVAKIKLPDEPLRSKILEYVRGTPSHGIGVTPDNKTLWVNSKRANASFVYSLPDLKLLGTALVGMDPDWLTFTPDSKRVYICNSQENTVSVVDTKTMKEVARIPVGQSPKRDTTFVLP
jgi:YVTN family beta-propeller protein